MSDTARGLQHLTSYSLAHNDFKPENVLIFKDPQGDLVAKIADLGLALGVYAIRSMLVLRVCICEGCDKQSQWGVGAHKEAALKAGGDHSQARAQQGVANNVIGS